MTDAAAQRARETPHKVVLVQREARLLFPDRWHFTEVTTREPDGASEAMDHLADLEAGYHIVRLRETDGGWVPCAVSRRGPENDWVRACWDSLSGQCPPPPLPSKNPNR